MRAAIFAIWVYFITSKEVSFQKDGTLKHEQTTLAHSSLIEFILAGVIQSPAALSGFVCLSLKAGISSNLLMCLHEF